MKISVTKDASDKSKCHVKITGQLDTASSFEFSSEIYKVLEKSNINQIIFDFSDVTYISSMCLRIVLELQRKMKENKGFISVKNAKKSVMEVFKITGFDKIIDIS